MIKFLLNLFLILLIFLLQTSLLASWNNLAFLVNLPLIAIIFIAVIIRYKLALIWAFLLGLLLDLYSPEPFGLTALLLLFTVIVVNTLFNNFFTDRSLASLLILGIISFLVYQFIFFLLNPSVNLIMKNLSLQLILHLGLLFLIFIIYRFLNKISTSYT